MVHPAQAILSIMLIVRTKKEKKHQPHVADKVEFLVKLKLIFLSLNEGTRSAIGIKNVYFRHF